MLDTAATAHESDNESVRSTHSSKSSASKGSNHQRNLSGLQNTENVVTEHTNFNTHDVLGSVIKKNCAVTLKKLDFGIPDSSSSNNAISSEEVPAVCEEGSAIISTESVFTSDNVENLTSPVVPRIQTSNIDTTQDMVDLCNTELTCEEQFVVSEDDGVVCVSSADEDQLNIPVISSSLAPESISEDSDVVVLSSASDESADESEILQLRPCTVQLEKLDCNYIPDDVVIGIETALCLTGCEDDLQTNTPMTEIKPSSSMQSQTVEDSAPLCVPQETTTKQVRWHRVSALDKVAVDQQTVSKEHIKYDRSVDKSPKEDEAMPSSPEEIPFNIENKDIYLSPIRPDSLLSLSGEKSVTNMDLSTSPEVFPALSMPRGSATEAQCLPPNDSKDIRDNIFDTDNYVTQMLYKMADQSNPEIVQTDAPASSADNISTSEQSTPDHSKVRLKLKKYSSAMRSKLKLAIENVRDKEHNHTVELTATATPTHNSTTTSTNSAQLSSCEESEPQPVCEVSKTIITVGQSSGKPH